MDKPIYKIVTFRKRKQCVFGDNKKIANKKNIFISELEKGQTEEEEEEEEEVVETPKVTEPTPDPEQTPDPTPEGEG